MVAWFTWTGEITAMRMLFNGNDSYHHFIISKILKSFLFNFPNWSCLWEPCAYPYFSMWKNHECCLPLNISSSWVFGFGPPQVWILSLRTIRCQNTNPFWTPDPIRSLWCLEGQMVVVAIRAPGLTPLPIAGWLALGYEALMADMAVLAGYLRYVTLGVVCKRTLFEIMAWTNNHIPKWSVKFDEWLIHRGLNINNI